MHNKKNYKVIIFDVDGTLLNTDELYFEILKEELGKVGYKLVEREFGEKLDDVIYNLDFTSKQIKKIKQAINKRFYHEQVLANLKFKQGAYAAIKELALRYKLSIGSGELLPQIEKYLKYLEISKYFPFIGHSKLVPNRKSNPYYFHKIADYFEVSTCECLMIGESIYDLQAENAGVDTIIIPSKFTRHYDFGKEVLIMNSLKEVTKYLR